MPRVHGKTPKQARHGDTCYNLSTWEDQEQKVALSFIVELKARRGYMRPFIKNIAMQNCLMVSGREIKWPPGRAMSKPGPDYL